MGILDEIVAHKRTEVTESKELYPVKLLERSPYFASETVSLRTYLQRPDSAGIIAEIKRRSPSKGALHPHLSVEQLSIGYMQAGASALSILTERRYFGGSPEDLKIARRFNFCPILRKDFIFDEYQVLESKSIGADVILLIARMLTLAELKELTRVAQSLGLEVLVEVHHEEELDRALESGADIIGVNNRNLDTLEMDVGTSFRLIKKIPADRVRISESGISEASTIADLRRAGFQGFLIGESFLKGPKPERSCQKLVSEVRRIVGDTDILQA